MLSFSALCKISDPFLSHESACTQLKQTMDRIPRNIAFPSYLSLFNFILLCHVLYDGKVPERQKVQAAFKRGSFSTSKKSHGGRRSLLKLWESVHVVQNWWVKLWKQTASDPAWLSISIIVVTKLMEYFF